MASAGSADLASLAADLAAASGGGMDQAAADILRQGAVRIQAQAKHLAPVKTGKLRDSIQIRQMGPLAVSIGPDEPYGVYQEYGTGSRGEFPGAPYTITPRNKRVLKFKVGNRTVFTRKVTHPGVRPTRFMRRAFLQVLGQDLASSLAKQGALLITRGPIK